MNPDRTCARCGANLADPTPEGLCPRCMLGSALDEDTVEASNAASRPEGRTASPQTSFPRRFGEYELLEEIGRGGMGMVFKARQLSLNRLVAVKMLLHGEFSNATFIQRFRTEAEAAGQLDHPNIVPIYEVGEHDGNQFFSMKLVEGPSLANQISNRNCPISNREAAKLLATVARAVHYAHQHGILHRDIKPQNILLDYNGEPHLTDFGLAKLLDRDKGLTLSEAVLGSPNFMAPEQAAGKSRHLTTAADVYSLGAVLYSLLTGRPPFEADTALETMRKVIEEEPLPPSQALRSSQPKETRLSKSKIRNPKSEIDKDLETICLKCLEKEPQRRYGSAEAFAEDLECWLRHEPILARPCAVLTRVTKWIRRKPVIAGLIIALHIIGLLGAAGVLWQWRRAVSGELQARQNLYASDMKLAQQALDQNNFGHALALLGRHRPAGKRAISNPKSESDLRGWEWRYLRQQCRSDEFYSLPRSERCVLGVAFSPDGRYLASGEHRGSIRIWDLASRRAVASCATVGAVCVLQFSPDGRWLVSAGFGHGLRLWEAQTLKSQGPPLIESDVYGARLDETTVMAADYDRQLLRRWDLASGRELPSHTMVSYQHEYEAWSVFSADGRTWASSSNNVILLWSSTNAAPLARLSGHDAPANPIAFSPDGRMLASGSLNGALLLWDTQTHRGITNFAAHSNVLELGAFSPDSKLLVTCSLDQTLKLWDVVGLRELGTLHGHREAVFAVAFSPDGQWIASGSDDGTIKVWKPELKPPAVTSTSLPGDLSHWSLSPDGQWLFLVFGDHSYSLWDLRTLQASTRQPLGSTNIRVAALGSGGRTVALGDSDGGIKLRDAVTLQEKMVLSGFADAAVARLSCSFDGSTLVAQSTNHLMKAWSLATGREVASFTRRNNVLLDRLPIAPDGRTIVTAPPDGTLELWDLPNLRSLPRQSFVASDRWWITGATFFRDGKRVATCSVDQTAKVWDLAAPGRPVVTMHSDLTGLVSVALSPDERRLAAGDELGLIRKVKVWDAVTGQELAVLPGPKEAIIDLAFWPDGDTLVSVSKDAVFLWRAPSWAEIDALEKAHATAH